MRFVYGIYLSLMLLLIVQGVGEVQSSVEETADFALRTQCVASQQLKAPSRVMVNFTFVSDRSSFSPHAAATILGEGTLGSARFDAIDVEVGVPEAGTVTAVFDGFPVEQEFPCLPEVEGRAVEPGIETTYEVKDPETRIYFSNTEARRFSEGAFREANDLRQTGNSPALRAFHVEKDQGKCSYGTDSPNPFAFAISRKVHSGGASESRVSFQGQLEAR